MKRRYQFLYAFVIIGFLAYGAIQQINITQVNGLQTALNGKSATTGDASIATVGTITSGTWSAAAIGPTKGGTGLTTYTLGDLLYASATNTLSALAGNTTTTQKVLMQTGNGSISAAPAWAALGAINQGNNSGTAVSVTTSETSIGTVSITPSSTTARIFIIATASFTKDAGTTVRTAVIRVKNNSSVQVGRDGQGTSSNVAANPFGCSAVIATEVPGSTSSQTYTLYGQATGATMNTITWSIQVFEMPPAGTAGATGATGATGPAIGISVNTQTGTSYTLVSGDNGKVIEFTNGSAVTVTLPSGLGTSFGCTIYQGGAGSVSIAASGTTIRNRQSLIKTAGQYASFSVLPTGTSNTYFTIGDMIP